MCHHAQDEGRISKPADTRGPPLELIQALASRFDYAVVSSALRLNAATRSSMSGISDKEGYS